MIDGIKKAGCCSICDVEVFDIVTRWPSDHATRANEPRRIGRPLPGTRRATLLLAWSGNISPVTLCPACELTPETIPSFWKKVLRTHARDLDDFYRVSIGLKPLGIEERKLLEKTIRIMASDVPIGVLKIEPWSMGNG